MVWLRNIKSRDFSGRLSLFLNSFLLGKSRETLFWNTVGRIKMYSKNNICIIPTYRCNANCSFCYAKGLYREFPNDMTWEIFRRVIDYCIENNKNEISFLGGEPTVWPYINRAVAYLKEKGVQISFFTNGITYSDPAPDCVLINIYNGFDNNTRDGIKKTINFYKDSGTEVTLRYNLVSDSSKGEDGRFFNFSVSLSDLVSISPAIPYVPDRNIGDRIFRLVKRFHRRGIVVKIARAMPVCLFNDQQYNYLRKTCLMRNRCYSEKNVVINPDGETLFPCVSVTNYEKKLFRESFEKINNDYKMFFQRLGKVFPFAKCKGCKYAFNNECQAGCLAIRSEDMMEEIIKLIKGKNDR